MELVFIVQFKESEVHWTELKGQGLNTSRLLKGIHILPFTSNKIIQMLGKVKI